METINPNEYDDPNLETQFFEIGRLQEHLERIQSGMASTALGEVEVKVAE